MHNEQQQKVKTIFTPSAPPKKEKNPQPQQTLKTVQKGIKGCQSMKT
jgi:hypothetical protein